MADNTARIAEIRQLLQSGVTSITIDGTTTQFNLDSLRRELRNLIAEDDVQGRVRPRLSSVNLSGLR